MLINNNTFKLIKSNIKRYKWFIDNKISELREIDIF